MNRNHIELKFFDFDLTHEELSRTLELDPTHRWYKDEEYMAGSKTKPVPMKRKQSYWGHEILTLTNGYIGDQIKEFLKSLITPRIAKIQKLTEKYHGEFSVVQYMYDGCNPGFFLDPDQLELINKCGLGLNIDFYVLSETSD
ncbi:DUF4279 domain-containing protein [Ekhidna sp.]|uniref:DUF4279 domain-containing protein n=1 Tax=Ekhidna sp. TaxID=2608089 RepID=UPI0032975DEB